MHQSISMNSTSTSQGARVYKVIQLANYNFHHPLSETTKKKTWQNHCKPPKNWTKSTKMKVKNSCGISNEIESLSLHKTLETI